MSLKLTYVVLTNFDYSYFQFLLISQTNTFQAIIMTNGNQSYAVFIYLCGALSSSGNVTDGTIGFNSDGSYFRNYPLSGTPRLPEVSCLNHPRTMWTNLLYSLTPSSGSLLYNYVNYVHVCFKCIL